MASIQHIPTELEAAADLALPAADELAGRFPLTPNPAPASPETYEDIMSTLAFGRKFTDHMAHMRWTREAGWTDHGVIAYGPLNLVPGASVFHYSQSVFEGIKAYKRADGSVWTFRPGYNAARINHSARRLALPEMRREDFVASLVDYVRADLKWVPEAEGASLYLRPFMFASEEFVGIHPAGVVDYYVIGSPSGRYFKNGLSGVAIWVEHEYHRAGPGGTGSAKTGGNYAASLLPQIRAEARGFSQVCFLDTWEGRYLEELGGMNMFVVMADGTVRTPELSGVILEGCTRSAILRMLREEGGDVREEKIVLDDVIEGICSGAVAEVFACGTAAVVTPITRLGSDDFDVELPVGDKTRQIHRRLIDIQWGRAADPYGWTYRLA
ncbi:branched-chain amino acid aminotransferase [Schaalia meyeri]|uniref:branched-chain amino acid aminotransferase n=1 Tax=Schaalia meyeri TaxID=52773 RepID=UPI000681F307|nr:branched-chain amino acid aminotransferase [Schaalia meyeri]AKU65137.1 branched-chain amino acid aminotransferase [Schaalia meyeri]OFQ21620.1 branched chain amino acid aminotransferase [Actinomyces sp. HMSC062G12]